MSPSRLLAVPDGAELVEWLGHVAAASSSAWIEAVGRLEAVELEPIGAGRVLTGPFILASLSGAAAGPYGVVLSRSTDTGLETLGGLLLRARALGVRVLVTACAGGPPLGLEQGAAAEAKPAQAGGWAAAATSVAEAVAAEQEEDALPEPGDLVQHFAFGLCEVLMSDGETLKIRDVRGTGRIREIRVDVLEVSSPSIRNGKRVFKLARRS